MPMFLRSFFSRAALLVALTSLAACSSSKKDDPAAAPTREMSWTADGATLKTTTLQSQKFSNTLSVAGTVPGSATFLSLEFPNAVGTYTFGPNSNATAAYTASSGGTVGVYFAGATGSGTVTGAGTIVVTALSATEVTGTFTFTGINPNTGASKSVSNGKFSVGL
ncbi:hypothetical protein JAO73_20565 [Hymenobacter sp. BT523]|nr:hypothetical protein [Hymenobacter sp. BT523]